MKVDLDFRARAYLANLSRSRSITLTEYHSQTISDRQKVEFEEEARYAESLALTLDAGEDLVLERKTPSIVDSRRDIDAIDAP